jgi:hypothetical protein
MQFRPSWVKSKTLSPKQEGLARSSKQEALSNTAKDKIGGKNRSIMV